MSIGAVVPIVATGVVTAIVVDSLIKKKPKPKRRIKSKGLRR